MFSTFVGLAHLPRVGPTFFRALQPSELHFLV